ncbi:hypothetical protein JD844_023105 [Phrynosoma platyrhinos]|uniref:Coiled-coil domain containing 150 n=1 Tax=Phrynosoma platyrhinos TaxID=52577 RepID=A0ABQ7SWI3_PHRPL|nr:hypothetical protein JD844_023105 [Phrynosoma platyrhinos]
MRVVEEQTNALLKDLRTLDVNGQSAEISPSKPLENSKGHQSISPIHAQVVFGGTNGTLWRTCETLVNRMCRLESVVQTLKLNMFRLQTEKELNPKHTANLEQRLNIIQEEHMEELKVLQAEGRMLCQQLQESQEEEEKARNRVERLRAALETATATKRDIAIAADELRATKKKMDHKLQELTEQLAKESSLRENLQESQAVLLYQMNDMEMMVEKERTQVHNLQQDCNTLRQDIQISRERLQKEEERKVQLEQECTMLKSKLESQEVTISRLNEEGKMLNEQLTQQCTELSGALQSVTMENAQLITQHQAVLKVEQEKINQKLQEQDLILDAARASIMEELKTVQNEKTQLQREIEALQYEHANCKQKACKVEETTATLESTGLLESTVATIRSELETMQKTIYQIMQDNKRLEAELEENKSTSTSEIIFLSFKKKLEIGPLKETLKTVEEENKKLMEREAALEYQQHAQQQVKQVVEELTDNKNKLAYDKGKLQINAELGSVRINAQRLEAQLKQVSNPVAKMPLKKRKSFESCWQQKPSDDFPSCLACDINGNVGLGEQACSQYSTTRRVRFMTDLPARESASDCGDSCKASPAIKTTEGILESEMDIPGPKWLQTAWDVASEGRELQRSQSALASREQDYSVTVKTCDEALRENQKLKGQISATEEREKHKVGNLRRKLEESKDDNVKMTNMLENVLASHNKMQIALKKMQTELRHKDSEIAGLKKDRIQSQQRIQKLEAELEHCHNKLVLDSQHTIKLYTDRLETLKKQFQIEREVTMKAAHKESTELKKALEEACSKSGEMSRCNRELRTKVMELESALASQKEKVKRQKTLITQYFNSKTHSAQNMERMKEIESELRQMEELKEQYQKKNHEQSLSIKQFITELTSLQTEMQQLAKNQQAMAAEKRNLESQLELERKRRKQLEEECQALEDTVNHLKKCKEHTEQKLKAASIESEQITANLEEAHHWFKSKFDSLQRELEKNKQQNNAAEHSCEEEVSRGIPSLA